MIVDICVHVNYVKLLNPYHMMSFEVNVTTVILHLI